MLTIARVLLVGGDQSTLSALHQLLESAGHTVSCSTNVSDAARHIGAGAADVVVLSRELVGSLDKLVDAQCGTAAARFIALDGSPAVASNIALLRASGADVVDPARGEHALLLAVDRAAREEQLVRELAMLRARVGDAARESLIGRSAAMTRVRELIGRAAGSRAPVIVAGEAGTGKDLVARLVHDLSDRATRPVVTVRCGAAAGDALELELFGREGIEGARARAGLLEEARGGTIVVDDAPLLPTSVRAQLSRAIASRAIRRLGGNKAIPVDARLVLTARITGADADIAAVEDLAARFHAMVIELPPLRERRSDIPQLVQHFRRRLATEQGLELAPLASEEMLPLLGKEWSGNVRELEHWVERDALAARSERPRDGALAGVDLGSSRATLEQLERAYILHVLSLESGHQSRAAVRLGIDRRTLYRKLKQYRSE